MTNAGSLATAGQKNGAKNQAINSNRLSKNSNASSHGSRQSSDSRAQIGQHGQQQVLKQFKLNKPTFNVQINNNVGNVNNSDGGALTMITKTGSGEPVS